MIWVNVTKFEQNFIAPNFFWLVRYADWCKFVIGTPCCSCVFVIKTHEACQGDEPILRHCISEYWRSIFFVLQIILWQVVLLQVSSSDHKPNVSQYFCSIRQFPLCAILLLIYSRSLFFSKHPFSFFIYVGYNDVWNFIRYVQSKSLQNVSYYSWYVGWLCSERIILCCCIFILWDGVDCNTVPSRAVKFILVSLPTCADLSSSESPASFPSILSLKSFSYKSFSESKYQMAHIHLLMMFHCYCSQCHYYSVDWVQHEALETHFCSLFLNF